MRDRILSRAWLTFASATLLIGCYEGIDAEDWYADESLGEFGDESTEGFGDELGTSGGEEGDGDPTTTTGDGDGDGDGDPTTSGDGDGDPTTSGDGDGDPTTSGDGDPDPTTSGDGDPDPTTGDGDGDGDGDPDPTTTTTDGDGDGDVPDNAYCDPVANWDSAWVERELEVLALVNEARSQGGNCDSQGSFPPSGPLTINPALTCAARVHSKDMADNDFFDHTNLEGNGPGWRLGQAGYGGGGWGENIAAGYSTPEQVVQGWLDSDGHCANMLNPNFGEIGIGYAYGAGSSYGHYWTQNFGS